MASNLVDSDSDDEYEVMNPLTVAELLKESQHVEALQPSKPQSEKEKKKVSSSTYDRATIERSQNISMQKRRGLFNRSKYKDKKAAVQKSESFSSSLESKVVKVSPMLSVKKKAIVKHTPVIKESRSAPITPIPLPRTIGPKPPRKLSEEELIKQRRQQQKELVMSAKQNHLRRLSEPSPNLRHKTKSSDYIPDYVIDPSYGELDTEDFVTKYSDKLPLDVVVSKGVYGMDDRYSLSTADRCIIHFIKRRELVQIMDPHTNKEFSVPLKSAIKFGVVYYPKSTNDTEAMNGLNFPYVSDILAVDQMPKIGVAYLKDPDIIGMNSMEVLAVKEVIYPDDPINPRKLRVYSLTAKCERDIPETQEINFNTRPNFMQLYLPEIMKHIPDPVPLYVAMYRNPLDRPLIAPGIPSSMFRRPLYMKKKFSDVLLIATGVSSEGTQCDQVFEVPTDIDVEFEVVKQSAKDREKMVESSRKLREKIKDKDVRHHRYVGMSDEEHRIQMSIYKAIREGGKLEGGVVDEDEEAVDGDYVKATSGNRLAMNHRVDLLEENMKRCSHSAAESKVMIAELSKENATLHERVVKLEEKLSNQYHQLEEMELISKQLDSIFIDMEQMRSQLDHLQTSKGVVQTSDLSPYVCEHESVSEIIDVAKRNRELLYRMTLPEVLQMLKLAGLEKYKDVFSTAGLSGDILSQCNEEVLEKELGISSKINRTKILHIITGKVPTKLYKLID